MKRKVISMLLCATMAVSMVGCGGGSSDTPASTPAESEAPAADEGASDAEAPAGDTAASGGGALEAFTPAEGSAVAVNSVYKPAADSSDWTIAVVVKDSSNGWFGVVSETQ